MSEKIEEIFSISEMVEDMRSKGYLNVNQKALRDRDDLIRPKKTAKNYRQYDKDARMRAEFVFGLNLAGIPEKTIKEFIELLIRFLNVKLKISGEENVRVQEAFNKIYDRKRQLELAKATIDILEDSNKVIALSEIFERA